MTVGKNREKKAGRVPTSLHRITRITQEQHNTNTASITPVCPLETGSGKKTIFVFFCLLCSIKFQLVYDLRKFLFVFLMSLLHVALLLKGATETCHALQQFPWQRSGPIYNSLSFQSLKIPQSSIIIISLDHLSSCLNNIRRHFLNK